MMRSTMKDKFHKGILKFLPIVFWLLIWQLVSNILHNEIILVSPIRVINTLFLLCGTGLFWTSILSSLIRIIGGFFLGLFVGIVLAVCSHQILFLKLLLKPITGIVKTTPVASFVILALIWIGSKNLAVFISFLMVFPVIYTNVLKGIENVNQEMLEMAQIFSMSWIKRYLYLYIPEVMPYFLSASSLSLGLCWKAGIAAEVIGLPISSIGEQLYQAKLYLSTEKLFAWTLVIIILSVTIEKLFMAFISACYKMLGGVHIS